MARVIKSPYEGVKCQANLRAGQSNFTAFGADNSVILGAYADWVRAVIRMGETMGLVTDWAGETDPKFEIVATPGAAPTTYTAKGELFRISCADSRSAKILASMIQVLDNEAVEAYRGLSIAGIPTFPNVT